MAVLAAAAVVPLALLGTWWALNGRSQGGAFVADFMSRAVEADVVESPDSASVSNLFMREFGVDILPVAVERARVSRAMVCLIRGQRAAMVEYLVDGKTVAHYRIPLTGSVMPRSQEVSTASDQGIQVASWTDDRFEHALVSELPEEILSRLARQQFASR